MPTKSPPKWDLLEFTETTRPLPPQWYPTHDPLGYESFVPQVHKGEVCIGGVWIPIPPSKGAARARCIKTGLGLYPFLRELFMRNEELACHYLHWEHACYSPSKRDYSGAPAPPLDDIQLGEFINACWPQLRRQFLYGPNKHGQKYNSTCGINVPWLRTRYNSGRCGPCRIYAHHWCFEGGRLKYIYNRGIRSPLAQVKKWKIMDPRYLDAKGNYIREPPAFRRDEIDKANGTNKQLRRKALIPKVGRGKRKIKAPLTNEGNNETQETPTACPAATTSGLDTNADSQ